MKVIKKKSKLKVLFGTFIMMVFIINIFPRILLNGSGEGYVNEEDGGKIGFVNVSIEAYVIQGGGVFYGFKYLYTINFKPY